MNKLRTWLKRIVNKDRQQSPDPLPKEPRQSKNEADSDRPGKVRRVSGNGGQPRRRKDPAGQDEYVPGDKPQSKGRERQRSGGGRKEGRDGGRPKPRRDGERTGRKREQAADPFAGSGNFKAPEHWQASDPSEVDIPPDHPFAQLGLSEATVKAVIRMGYEQPTDIQARSIPSVLEGRDIIGASQTGTGKTAAFVLPILTRMEKHGSPRCLILEPTRELAAQIEDALIEFARYTDIRTLLLHGGVPYGRQIDQLNAGMDIIVATPGRLLDHMERGTLNLDTIDFLVLDEVDRMLDMGFLPDVRRIVERCSNKERQTLFFSATMPPQIQTLASFALDNPVEVEIGVRLSVAETVTHAFYPVAHEQRPDLLLALLKATDYHSVMIFTRTKAECDRIHTMLGKEGYKATVMHSDIRQSERTKALSGFRDGTYDIIVATDVAARGLDISDVTHVINFRVPENPEDYVHRIGRTGRAKKEGDAFTLVSGEELEYIEAIERLIQQKVDRKKLDNFNYIYTALLDDDVPTGAELKKALGRRKPSGGRRRRLR